jgi:hypothetical protein
MSVCSAKPKLGRVRFRRDMTRAKVLAAAAVATAEACTRVQGKIRLPDIGRHKDLACLLE